MIRKIKEALVAAYARGAGPVFGSVSPSGRDEIWTLGNVAVVVPVIPPDASSALEYALLLRRDAISSGTCPNCKAVTTVEGSGELHDDLDLGSALFAHRSTCPGEDGSARRLLEAHWRTHDSQSLSERIEDVQLRSRSRVLYLHDDGIPIFTAGDDKSAARQP